MSKCSTCHNLTHINYRDKHFPSITIMESQHSQHIKQYD